MGYEKIEKGTMGNYVYAVYLDQDGHLNVEIEPLLNIIALGEKDEINKVESIDTDRGILERYTTVLTEEEYRKGGE